MKGLWIALAAVCLLSAGCDISTAENESVTDGNRIESVTKIQSTERESETIESTLDSFRVNKKEKNAYDSLAETEIEIPEEGENKSAYEKGKELGENLSEKLENIDWEENYDKARDAGQEAAEWLNKLLDQE